MTTAATLKLPFKNLWEKFQLTGQTCAQIVETPKKLYVAYKISQNIACMEVQRQRIVLYLKLDPKEIQNPLSISRDVANIGHSGTGDFEITVKSESDFETAKPFIEMAYQKVGS